MTLYNVYLQREIGATFLDIEADSPEDAASKARRIATGFADRIDDGEDLSAKVEVAEPTRAHPALTLDFPAGRVRLSAPEFLELAKRIIRQKDTDESAPVDIYNAAVRLMVQCKLDAELI